jgi:hypothetical protein
MALSRVPRLLKKSAMINCSYNELNNVRYSDGQVSPIVNNARPRRQSTYRAKFPNSLPWPIQFEISYKI